MRYKLVLARSWRGPLNDGEWLPARYFEAEDDSEAEYLAQREGEPVLLCRSPSGGSTQPLGLIGDKPEAPAKRKR